MIKEFKGDYAFLSNFFLALQEVYHEYFARSFLYPSNEHYFQAMKTLDLGQHIAISNAPTPGIAKKMGSRRGFMMGNGVLFKIVLRPDWNNIKLGVMSRGVEHKIRQHPNLLHLLLKTYPMDLQEGNWWGDDFWGVCFKRGKGYNHLGSIIKILRGILLSEHLKAMERPA